MENQNGRSMIEMLGVLAIVGILSVGGIAGYSKAMTKYRINQLTEEFVVLMEEILPHSAEIKKSHKNNKSSESVNVASVLEIFLPKKWSRKGEFIYDSTGNRIRPFIRNDQDGPSNKYLNIDYQITKGESKAKTELCLALYNNLAKPYANILRKVGVWSTNDQGGQSLMAWGDNYCKNGVKCLRDLTPSEMIDNCKSCSEDKTSCAFVIMFVL